MKKIMISLLMVAATMSAMAATVAGKATITLKAENGKSCKMTITELSDGVAGLNDGWYGELNEEGKEVWFYVLYNGVKYQSFGSNEDTMKDLQIGIKTNASTNYTLTASNLAGKAFKLKINGVEYTVDASMNNTPITLEANATLPAAGDEAKYKVNPSVVAKAFCFRNNILSIDGYKGESVTIDGTVVNITVDNFTMPFTAAGRHTLVIDSKEYLFDSHPEMDATKYNFGPK